MMFKLSEYRDERRSSKFLTMELPDTLLHDLGWAAYNSALSRLTDRAVELTSVQWLDQVRLTNREFQQLARDACRR